VKLDDLSEPTRAWFEAGRHVAIAEKRMFVFERRPQAGDGAASGTPQTILLLHGYPTSSYDWRGIVERLSLRYRTMAPDLFGFGLSDKPAAYSYSLFQQADTIEELMTALGVQAAHVVSHDMGTSLHSELLARQEEGRLGFCI
jgi:pimeloyl-ACP methyl ester carboxylesterase